VGVYRYIALVNYNKGNKAVTQSYIDKIVAIDANDALAKQLKDLLAKPAATKAPKK
jgi:hypothetical protein